MVASDDTGEFARTPGGVVGDRRPNPVHHLARVADVWFEGWPSVDAELGDVDFELDIVVFQRGGCGDDGGGAVTRTGPEGRGAIDGDGNEYGGR